MSGRSAFVRTKTAQLAEDDAFTHYEEFMRSTADHDTLGVQARLPPGQYAAPQLSVGQLSTSTGTTGLPLPVYGNAQQLYAVSEQGFSRTHPVHTGVYPSQLPVLQPQLPVFQPLFQPQLPVPQPLVVASAIEKSKFQVHFNGVSSNVRSKLGKLMRPTKSSSSQVKSARLELHLAAPQSIHAMFDEDHSGESSLPEIKRFEGHGKPANSDWKSLSDNPKLNNDNGDTQIFMYMLGTELEPQPSFRVDSSVIFNSGSTFFIDLLNGHSKPTDMPWLHEIHSQHENIETLELSNQGKSRSTEKTLGDNRDVDISPSSKKVKSIDYKIYLAWPGEQCGIDSTTWFLTTRNFFAMLFDDRALCGTTLLSALAGVSERIATNPGYLSCDTDAVRFITDYVVRHQFDDVRNEPSFAASLLAFSERSEIRWKEGYAEAFVHCVGMYDYGICAVPEWGQISTRTRLVVSHASMELEERVVRAQDFLGSFDVVSKWPSTCSSQQPERVAYERLRKWLAGYYAEAAGAWPPTDDPIWLTRGIVRRLSQDFNGLYDYLVNRDIVSERGHGSHQYWKLTSISGRPFRSDSESFPLAELMMNFDEANHFPHMPHPYPITPPSAPSPSKQSKFLSKKSVTTSEAQAIARRKALSYAEASNVYILDSEHLNSELLTAFVAFEQSDQIDQIDPFEARKGRWLLIYGILQILAIVSVDTPNLRYTDDVHYHLSSSMKGVVPWAPAHSPPTEEAPHANSHCWTIPKTWPASHPRTHHTASKPANIGRYGHGSTHPDPNATAQRSPLTHGSLSPDSGTVLSYSAETARSQPRSDHTGPGEVQDRPADTSHGTSGGFEMPGLPNLPELEGSSHAARARRDIGRAR